MQTVPSRITLWLTLLLIGTACSSSDPAPQDLGNRDRGVSLDTSASDKGAGDLGVNDPDYGTDPWQALAARLSAAFSDGEIQGPFLLFELYDARDGQRVYSGHWGQTRSRDDLLPVASASKWVTSTAILALVADGTLTLDDTIGQWLGWIGKKAPITIRQLLSFTSGLAGVLCTYSSASTLEECVNKIYLSTLESDPGTAFDYNSSHMAVLGRIAEVASQKSWATIIAEKISTPAGFTDDATYYTLPQQRQGLQNPLIAGGLVTSVADYGRFLSALQGLDGKPRLIPQALLNEQIEEQWAPGTIITYSPIGAIHYGLGLWRHCATPDQPSACSADMVAHSAGAYGFVPFRDLKHGYYGVLGAEAPDTHSEAGLSHAQLIFDELRPLIVGSGQFQ